jgi:hypothetical protein
MKNGSSFMKALEVENYGINKRTLFSITDKKGIADL